MRDTERWLPVVGHEENYEVSSWGQVRSRPRPRTKGGVLKPWLMNDIYPAVRLRRDGRSSNARIHRLVAEAFIGPCPPGQEVRHLDTDSTNNRLSNIAYGTRVQNAQDGLANGKNPRAAQTHCAHGHKFDEKNTRIRIKNGRPARECIACQKNRNAARPKGYWRKYASTS